MFSIIICISTTEKQPFSDVLEKRFSEKFRKIHEKTPVLESLFNKVSGLKACKFIKKETMAQMFFCEIYEIFKNTFFHRIPSVATSENTENH